MCHMNKGEWGLNFNPDVISAGREARRVCKHAIDAKTRYSLLPISIMGTEYMAVSCHMCDMIRLINPQDPSQEPVVAYKGNRGDVGPMCLGPTGTLCVVGMYRSWVSLLDCTSTKFSLKRRLYEIEDLWTENMCYIDVHDFIVLNSKYNVRICAVRISDGHIVWDKSKEVVDGKEWFPKGLAFLRHHHLFLVGDRFEKRILILSPTMGDILQTVPLQQKTQWISDLHLINDKLLVHHLNKLSYYSVSYIV